MAVIQKIGQNTFNKTGFMLVSKITNVPVRRNKKLNFCDCVVFENTEGKKIKIYSQKNRSGRLIKRKILDEISGLKKLSFYKWFEPLKITPKNKYMLKYNPNAFTNSGLRRRDVWLGLDAQDDSTAILKTKYTVIDINNPTKVVTKTVSQGSGRSARFDENEISEIRNGSVTKKLSAVSVSRSGELNETIYEEGFNISENKLKKITSFPYFYAMLKHPLDFVQAAKTRALYNQGVDVNVPLIVISDPKAKYSALFDKNSRKILYVKEDLMNSTPAQIAPVLEHEARHEWQIQLVQKLEKGELVDKKEIEQAKEFKYNLENYITERFGMDIYEHQPVEADANAVSDKVYDSMFNAIKYIGKIFDKARLSTFGL